LGYLVPNHLIRAALFERASQADNVTILNELTVDGVNTTNTGAEVSLSNGKTIKSKLVVAADSRFSEIRRKMGIPSVMKDFSKVMITTRMSHEKAHNHVALECFNYGHTLALLPLNGNVSSFVLTVPTDRLDEMLDLDEEQLFFHEMSHALATILTGGIVQEMAVTLLQGGHVLSTGGSRFIILNAGYLGSLILGAIIYLLARHTRWDRTISALLGLIILVISLFFVRNFFGFFFGIASGLVLLWLARYSSEKINDILLRVVGLTSMIYVPLDIFSDTISRSYLRSDARMLAEEFGGATILWGGIWIVLSVIVIYKVVKTSTSLSTRKK
jgi:hypothetical protein